MSNSFCASCGQELKIEGQAFCTNCGAPVQSGASSAEEFTPLNFDFQGQKFPDFSEDAFTHHQANLVIVGTAAESWFPGKSIDAQGLARYISAPLPEFASQYSINENFLGSEKIFEDYESILWEDSTIGARFLEQMSKRGASISHGYFGRQVEVPTPDGKTELLPLSTPLDLYAGNWGLSEGTPFLQKGQVFKSKKSGKEFVYWHIDALVNTRYFTEEPKNNLALRIGIPHYLQTAMYLAETPFPSSLISGMTSRESSFGIDGAKTPRPLIRHQRDGISVARIDSDQGPQAVSLWAPELIQLGYLFSDDMSDEEMYESLPTACDGISKIAEIIVDGFANWRPGSDLDFQACLMSEYPFDETPEDFKFGALVPGVIYGVLCQRTLQAYGESYSALQDAIAKNDGEGIRSNLIQFLILVDSGIGSSICHAANSFANTAIELGMDWDVVLMLEYISTIDVDSQGVNALSNLVRFFIEKDNFAEANKYLDLALEKTKRMGPNLETLSHWAPWDGSGEENIYLEIFESALTVKSELGKSAELKSAAQRVIDYCDTRKITPELLNTAKAILN